MGNRPSAQRLDAEADGIAGSVCFCSCWEAENMNAHKQFDDAFDVHPTATSSPDTELSQQKEPEKASATSISKASRSAPSSAIVSISNRATQSTSSSAASVYLSPPPASTARRSDQSLTTPTNNESNTLPSTGMMLSPEVESVLSSIENFVEDVRFRSQSLFSPITAPEPDEIILSSDDLFKIQSSNDIYAGSLSLEVEQSSPPIKSDSTQPASDDHVDHNHQHLHQPTFSPFLDEKSQEAARDDLRNNFNLMNLSPNPLFSLKGLARPPQTPSTPSPIGQPSFSTPIPTTATPTATPSPTFIPKPMKNSNFSKMHASNAPVTPSAKNLSSSQSFLTPEPSLNRSELQSNMQTPALTSDTTVSVSGSETVSSASPISDMHPIHVSSTPPSSNPFFASAVESTHESNQMLSSAHENAPASSSTHPSVVKHAKMLTSSPWSASIDLDDDSTPSNDTAHISPSISSSDKAPSLPSSVDSESINQLELSSSSSSSATSSEPSSSSSAHRPSLMQSKHGGQSAAQAMAMAAAAAISQRKSVMLSKPPIPVDDTIDSDAIETKASIDASTPAVSLSNSSNTDSDNRPESQDFIPPISARGKQGSIFKPPMMPGMMGGAASAMAAAAAAAIKNRKSSLMIAKTSQDNFANGDSSDSSTAISSSQQSGQSVAPPAEPMLNVMHQQQSAIVSEKTEHTAPVNVAVNNAPTLSPSNPFESSLSIVEPIVTVSDPSDVNPFESDESVSAVLSDSDSGSSSFASFSSPLSSSSSGYIPKPSSSAPNPEFVRDLNQWYADMEQTAKQVAASSSPTLSQALDAPDDFSGPGRGASVSVISPPSADSMVLTSNPLFRFMNAQK